MNMKDFVVCYGESKFVFRLSKIGICYLSRRSSLKFFLLAYFFQKAMQTFMWFLYNILCNICNFLYLHNLWRFGNFANNEFFSYFFASKTAIAEFFWQISGLPKYYSIYMQVWPRQVQWRSKDLPRTPLLWGPVLLASLLIMLRLFFFHFNCSVLHLGLF